MTSEPRQGPYAREHNEKGATSITGAVTFPEGHRSVLRGNTARYEGNFSLTLVTSQNEHNFALLIFL